MRVQVKYTTKPVSSYRNTPSWADFFKFLRKPLHAYAFDIQFSPTIRFSFFDDFQAKSIQHLLKFILPEENMRIIPG